MSFPSGKHSGDGLDEFDVSQIVTEYPFNMPWHFAFDMPVFVHTHKNVNSMCANEPKMSQKKYAYLELSLSLSPPQFFSISTHKHFNVYSVDLFVAVSRQSTASKQKSKETHIVEAYRIFACSQKNGHNRLCQ